MRKGTWPSPLSGCQECIGRVNPLAGRLKQFLCRRRFDTEKWVYAVTDHKRGIKPRHARGLGAGTEAMKGPHAILWSLLG